jgi:hypothetical protein
MTETLPYYLDPVYSYDENNPFVGTDRFSPVALGFDKPDPRDPYHVPVSEWDPEYVAKNCTVDKTWWYKQRERSLYGYSVKNARKDNSTVSITGRHYWYLNFWWIYGKSADERIKAKTLIRPKFIDIDYEVAYVFESMFEYEKDSDFLKARQKGLSEKLAGMLMAYNYTFIPYSQNIIIAGNIDDSEHTMNNVKRGLDQLINTQFYKIRKKNTKEHVQSKSFGSEVISLTAGSQGMQSVSRFSPFCIMYEEVGKWAKGLVTATKQFVDASLYNEGKKTGWSFYIGTGGNMDAGAADLEDMHNKPAEHNLLENPDIHEPEHMRSEYTVGYFIPAWKYCIIDKDGNSLKEPSIKFHEAKLAQLSDKKKFLYRVNNPNHPHEAFLIPSGGYFGKEAVEKMSSRRSEILRTAKLRNVAMYGTTHWKDPKDWSKGAYFKQADVDGGDKYTVIITEEPKIDATTGRPYENLYKQATDSYDRDEANTSTSLGSSVIGHGFLDIESPSNYVVARLTIRPETFEGGAEAFYEEVLKLNIMYNAINLIEYSNLRIFDFYKNHGFSHMLKERPQMMISRWIQNTQVNNQYGIDPSSKPFWLSALSDFIKKGDYSFINNCYDEGLLRALSRFRYDPSRRYNCDITISMALLVVLFEDEAEIEVIKHQEKRYETPRFGYKRISNNFVLV